MRLALFTMCLAAAMLLAPSHASAISIIWVTENSDGAAAPSPDDSGWTDFLVANGHVVTRVDNRVLDAPKIAAMEAADLVIVSRDTNSGNYDDGSEVADWNGITTPLILMSQYLSRSSRWKWISTGGLPGNGDGAMSVVDASHPIFAGLGLSNGDTVDLSTNNTPAMQGNNVGNGTLLATDNSNTNATIVHWTAGTEFYAGSGQTAGGDRLFLGLGNDDNNPKGAFGLNGDGEELFLNAVEHLAGVPEPATFGLVGLAATGLIMRRRRSA